MKYSEEYRDAKLVRPLTARLLADIAELEKERGFSAERPLRIMEVCGTHTMSIFKSGLKSLLPSSVALVSGPGCPVCVTAAAHIDYLVDVAMQKEVIMENGERHIRKKIRITLFGDMFRVPGSQTSLGEASANGALIQIVYSPMDALQHAISNPDELIIFAAVGFETTSPIIAATILAAERGGVENFLVFPCLKTMIEPLHSLFSAEDLRLDGLLCPGHVATIIGVDSWQDLAAKFNLASVVAGFETADLIEALLMLCKQIKNGIACVENGYPRAVKQRGNERAQAMVKEVFTECDMLWRGLGVLPKSGLAIAEKYRAFDAGRLFPFSPAVVQSSYAGGLDNKEGQDLPKSCRCGEVLRGRITPEECSIFRKTCTPSHPIGPCMVSGEGVCAAHYKYGEHC